MEPLDINYFPLTRLKWYLIDVNKLRNFEDSYDSLIEKSLGSFWDYDKATQNSIFLNKI